MLDDMLAGPGVSSYKPGQYQVPVVKRMNSDSDFQWETWTAPSPESVQEHLQKAARVDKLSKDDPEWLKHATETNYLEDGVLDKVNEADEATAPRLKLALERFGAFEKDSITLIEGIQKRLA
jgi:transaldolase